MLNIKIITTTAIENFIKHYYNMSLNLRIKKGLDIKIAGAIASSETVVKVSPKTVAVVPDDFPGFTPKVEVKDGDNVTVGQPLLHDKHDEQIKLVAPVSGTVKGVVRGERRKIERVVIEPAADTATQSDVEIPQLSTAEEVAKFLKNKGLWAMIRQRPYDIVPSAMAKPRDIFVTAIDSAPLAINPAEFIAADKEALAKGVELLQMLTKGKVYVSRRHNSALSDIEGAEMVDIEGPHPAGNVGVQIANISPINKGETIWTLDAMTLWRIGRAALTGVVPTEAYVAVVGSEIAKPQVVCTTIGADVESIVSGNLKADERNKRIIAGNVLSGTKIAADGYLRFPYRQLTVIPEGNDVDEFMGWASISLSKNSESRSFPGHFFKKIFNPDARLKGGRRAFIMSGEYDRYLPMDIMSEFLIKAIIGRDIEQMEKLGIYEVAPEDFALGEYADTSKIEAQKIVREGLDYLRKELE